MVGQEGPELRDSYRRGLGENPTASSPSHRRAQGMPSDTPAIHQGAQPKGQLLLEKPVFSRLQVSQPLPAAEARDSSPEDGRSCAAKPGPSLAPVDHEYPHYLEKVWGGEREFFNRSRPSFFLYARGP